MTKPMSIMWLGLRGFPQVQGGVEKHAEHLCRNLSLLGCDVTVIVRPSYQPRDIGPDWQGIRFKPIWAPRSATLEAIVHTFLGVVYAAATRPDILHIQGIGPSLMTPMARLLGLRVVVTHHGPDYERQKWGKLGKQVLRLGERIGMHFSHARIVISKGIQELIHTKYKLDSAMITNGVELPELPDSSGALDKFGLVPCRYVLMVSRVVPEKRHHDLIKAFTRAALPGWKLVLVGNADHPDAYARSVLEAAKSAENVVCTGFQTGEALRQIYAHAGVFVLPSSHEGLPIAILEAISYGLPVIASDIPANREINCSMVSYYPLGDVAALSERLKKISDEGFPDFHRENARCLITENYKWDDAASKTFAVYESVIASRRYRGKRLA